MFGHCYVVHYLVSFLVLQSSAGVERAGCLTLMHFNVI